MTIYAIVNNLISGSHSKEGSPAIWTIISGASILQGGNPFFVPDFASRFEALPALAVKIGKLGKGIAPRFAYRYVDSVAPCVLFAATDLLHTLRQQGLPWTRAISYDKCLAIGRFIKIPFTETAGCRVTLNLEDKETPGDTIWESELHGPTTEEALSAISTDNTLKTGDIILIGIAGKGACVAPGMKASLSLNDGEPSRFNIR
ncbi:MAG: fumarylacetoacetate hydrolase family protein [Muribaculaceae bacterium]|nr:fumarylacetoacetate hydrolase family protein [Muribaculaceae bacterium]